MLTNLKKKPLLKPLILLALLYYNFFWSKINKLEGKICNSDKFTPNYAYSVFFIVAFSIIFLIFINIDK